MGAHAAGGTHLEARGGGAVGGGGDDKRTRGWAHLGLGPTESQLWMAKF